jgi:hypothetical protein
MRLAVAGLIIATGLTLILTIGVNRPAAEGDEPKAAHASALPAPNAAAPPRGVPAPVDRPNASDEKELAAWAKEVGGLTGIPARAVRAYGLAEMWMRSDAPKCRLTWSTLAGIAQVASKHGGEIDKDGELVKPVVGKNDRVGPLHLSLAKWKAHRFRASRDGQRPDPQQIDDAAVTTARALCARGGDMRKARHWWSAVAAHGGSTTFAQHVFVATKRYAKASAAAGR